MRTVVLTMIAVVALAGCASEPARLALRRVPDPPACPAPALPLPLVFRIDPLADEQIVAIGPDGARYHVWWSPAFEAGDLADPVVRDPAGDVVLRDGESVRGTTLHGHALCVDYASESIYVLIE